MGAAVLNRFPDHHMFLLAVHRHGTIFPSSGDMLTWTCWSSGLAGMNLPTPIVACPAPGRHQLCWCRCISTTENQLCF